MNKAILAGVGGVIVGAIAGSYVMYNKIYKYLSVVVLDAVAKTTEKKES